VVFGSARSDEHGGLDLLNSVGTALERAQTENRVMTEMTGLSFSRHEYRDVVQALLDLVEQVVVSPLLVLSVQESDHPGHYLRIGKGVDPLWAEDAGRCMVEIQNHYLSPAGVPTQRMVTRHSVVPPAWMVTFPAETRSGRVGSLSLVSSAPLSIVPEEEQLMMRLMNQILLVLDHALLLKRVENLEMVDRLTGAANLRRLLETLEYEMQRHRFAGKRLALLVLDVEGLDSINRTYGRRYGNHILEKLAGLVRSSVRPIDTVARYGLDEFAVILPEMNEEEGRELAEQLHQRVLAVEFAGGEIGLSAGVAHVKPDETLTPEAVVWRAEQALHEAKRQERDWSALWQAGNRGTGSA